MKIKHDAWSKENDVLLAKTVLRHIREGSTLLNAFEEMSDKLNKTAAACGSRWNTLVRKQYEKGKTQDMRIPPDKAANSEKKTIVLKPADVTVNHVIDFL
jgi:RsfA family transcription factor